ncbi:MAG: SMP-30/gluconolactonase/LRE family protein [Chthoniobacteraceae bacterium]
MSFSKPSDRTISTLINEHCELAENPLWRVEDGCLYWTDITAGKLHRMHIEGGAHEIIYHGVPVGGFTFQANGDLMLFRVKDIALLHPDGEVETVRAFEDEGTERFNDVIADPEGRVFAGTIGRTETSGGLWRMDTDGTMILLFRGTGCSNGMGFSPGLTKFHWTCSTRRRIFAFDYDHSTGRLSGERVFYQAGADEGIPDGLTVDSTGHIWSARWDGHAVMRHAPDGTLLERIPFPVGKITSLCFGGPQLDHFFVTSAGGKLGSETDDGAIYRFPAGVTGAAEFRSQISTGR